MTKLPMSLRTAEAEAAYQAAKGNGGTEPLQNVTPIKEWTHWKLIPNQFPYDMAFRRHNMLIPKRTFATRDQMRFDEWQELQNIIQDYVEKHYDVLMDNMGRRRSNPVIYHIHLANYHRKREDVKL